MRVEAAWLISNLLASLKGDPKLTDVEVTLVPALVKILGQPESPSFLIFILDIVGAILPCEEFDRLNGGSLLELLQTC
jgi:hypothetical protein